MAQGPKIVTARPLRIAIVPQPSRGWIGGVNYFRNLCEVLLRFAGSRIQPVLFLGTDVDPELATVFKIPGLEIHQNKSFDATAIRRRTILALGGVRDRLSVATFQSLNIDIIFETMAFFGSPSMIPSLAWFPDFQHRRLPEMFSWLVRARRDLLVRKLLAGGRTLMLSSRDAEKDAQTYFGANGRTAVVSFSLPAPTRHAGEWQADASLGIPHDFVYLPNQIWRHKNHELAIDALALLPEADRLSIVSTGAVNDPRDPHRFDMLQRRARDRGLGKSFLFLGLRPYSDVAGLLQSAVAVLNTSRFEGWSTTVEECKAAGVPMLLSDIPVHREQAEGVAAFFPPDDAEALAILLRGIKQGYLPPKPDALKADDRAAQFAAQFADAAEHALRNG